MELAQVVMIKCTANRITWLELHELVDEDICLQNSEHSQQSDSGKYWLFNEWRGRKLKLPKSQATVFYYMRMQNGNDMLCLLQMAIDGSKHSESGFEMRKQRGAKTN